MFSVGLIIKAIPSAPAPSSSPSPFESEIEKLKLVENDRFCPFSPRKLKGFFSKAFPDTKNLDSANLKTSFPAAISEFTILVFPLSLIDEISTEKSSKFAESQTPLPFASSHLKPVIVPNGLLFNATTKSCVSTPPRLSLTRTLTS